MKEVLERLHLAGITLDEMRSLAPAFEAVPYAEALRRRCAALRAGDGLLLVVLGDPFDLGDQVRSLGSAFWEQPERKTLRIALGDGA